MESLSIGEVSQLKSIHEHIADLRQPRRSINPIASHMASASHSAMEKCPGKTGSSFISTSKSATAIPNIVMSRLPKFFSTSQNDRHAMNHPVAAAMEPTSVTGTRIASPSNKPKIVADAMPTTATEGVKNVS